MRISELRNLRDVTLDLHPGLNVFAGRNAQGKTSVLEALALLARGRSFRTDDLKSVVRRGASGLTACGRTVAQDRITELEVSVDASGRTLRVDGRDVLPRAYQGRLEVVVYSTDRLRVVRGTMRDRRQYVDRQAAALWPGYRQALREFERVLLQRNAALLAGGRDLAAWDEGFLATGSRLRQRRAAFVTRLDAALREGFRPRGESYAITHFPPAPEGGEAAQRAGLEVEMEARRQDERRARRSLVGPHRDQILLSVDGQDAASFASSGQVRSLLLALALASLAIYRVESGTAAVALLDDLDSELDAERAAVLCAEVSRVGQALVTTAHPGWAERVATLGRLFEVDGGQVRAA